MQIELRTGPRHQIVLGTEASLEEATALAEFLVNDPRDVKAPMRIFFYDVRAQQYCGWVSRKASLPADEEAPSKRRVRRP